MSLYSVAKVLARQLELPLTLNASMAPPALRKFNTDPTAHKSDNVPPEIALIATVIIAVKMIYGLDGKKAVWVAPHDFNRARHLISDCPRGLN